MKKIKNKNERILYIDILNIVAIISVVALHCNGIVHQYSLSRAWATSLIVECVCYFAVPVFIMATGAKLLDYRKKYDTKTFFKKRFSKVLIPSIFWIFIMIIWKLNLGMLEINNIRDLLNIIFSNKMESTYYFIWEIMGIYLTLPIISKIIENEKDNNLLWYYVIIFTIFNSFLPYIFSVFNITYNKSFSIRIADYYIYIILGYLLSKIEINKKSRVFLYIAGILSILFRYIITYFLSTKYGYLDRSTWGYTQFHSIILSSAVFVFIKNIKYDIINDKVKIIIAKIANCSFGIYLIHLIVKYYIVHIFNINVLSWKFRTFGIIAIYLISLLIILLLKKIPIIKKIVA